MGVVAVRGIERAIAHGKDDEGEAPHVSALQPRRRSLTALGLGAGPSLEELTSCGLKLEADKIAAAFRGRMFGLLAVVPGARSVVRMEGPVSIPHHHPGAP